MNRRSLSELAPSVRDAVEHYHTLLSQRFGQRLREVVVFGSQARGEATDESDVDILVVIDGLTESERVAVVDLAYDVDARPEAEWVGLMPLAYPTELANTLRARERLLMREIDRDGIRA